MGFEKDAQVLIDQNWREDMEFNFTDLHDKIKEQNTKLDIYKRDIDQLREIIREQNDKINSLSGDLADSNEVFLDKIDIFKEEIEEIKKENINHEEKLGTLELDPDPRSQI